MRGLLRFIVRIVLVASVVGFATPTSAVVHVRGYYRKNGTYVQPHTRSNPSSSGSSYRYTAPTTYRSSARTYPRNTARTSYDAGDYGGGNYGAGGATLDDAAESFALATEPTAPPPNNAEIEHAKVETDAQARLERGESYERSEAYAEAVRDYVSVFRRWPRSKAAEAARKHVQRLRDDEPFRVWRSKTGGFSIVAKFIEEIEHRIRLETRDAKTMRIEFTKLSAPDQLYVVARRTPL